MSVLHLVLAVVWLFVSIAFALLARYKYKYELFVDGIIWTDVVSSVLAFVIFIIYVVQIVLEVGA